LERGIAAAHYLQAKRVRFTDPYLLTQGKGKLACSFARWGAGLPVPDTILAPTSQVTAAMERFGVTYPVVCKADVGKKGRDNHLVAEESQLMDLLATTAEQKTDMLVQPCIPNDGDYRVLVVGGQARVALHRQGDGSSHLTNTSAGGSAELVKLADLPPKMIDIAERSAELERLTVAGVDIMLDRTTQRPYILEVNRAPQVPTGAFAPTKMQGYADGLQAHLRTAPNSPLTIIGRAEHVNLTGHGAAADMVPAKVDTGADLSSIWASKIAVTDGTLRFTLFAKGAPWYTGEVIELAAGEYHTTRIANSFGDREIRYVVKMRLRIGGRTVNTSFSLADRSRKIYPILLGRRLLKGKFVVDVNRGTPLVEAERNNRRRARLASRLDED
jgi:hypothetical protein